MRTYPVTMRSVRFHRLIACWHGVHTPRDEEWELFLSLLRAADRSTVRGLVVTAGGAPTPAQQLTLAREMGLGAVPVAVLSDHVGVRFVASSLALITRRIRCFGSSMQREAFAHLELEAGEIAFAQRFLAECDGVADSAAR